MMRLVLMTLCVSTLYGQWDPGGPNARLFLQGKVPSVVDPIEHQVDVIVPGFLDVTIDSGNQVGMPLILAVSHIDPSGSVVRNIPGMGSLNIGTPAIPLPTGIQILGDGISLSVNPFFDLFYATSVAVPSRFTRSIFLGASANGVHMAFQSVVADPSAAPFGLDLTEAGDGATVVGIKQILNHSLSDSLPFSFVTGSVFHFHGQSYSSLFVQRSGFVSFGAATTVTFGGFTQDARSFVAAQPAIAAWLGDWDPQAYGPNDGVLVRQTNNVLDVLWGDSEGHPSGAAGCAHFGDTDTNRFGLRLVLDCSSVPGCQIDDPNPGVFEISIDHAAPNPQVRPGDGLIGQTPGAFGLAASFRDSDLRTPANYGANEAAIEEHNQSTQAASMVGFNGRGTPRYFSDIRSWSGSSVRFTPNPAAPAGSLGYSTTSYGVPPDRVASVIPDVVARSGGQQITVVGKFHGFNSSAGTGGQVFFADGFGHVAPATVVGLFDDTGILQPNLANPPGTSPVRNGEGLVIQVPDLSAFVAPVFAAFIFHSGFSTALPVQVYDSVSTAIYSPGDDGVIRYRLLNGPVLFHGIPRHEMFISANGVIGFDAPPFDFSSSMFELMNGIYHPGNAAIAVYWTDLVPIGGGVPATVTIEEDPFLGEVRVSWQGYALFGSNQPVGDLRLRFLSGNRLNFDLTQALIGGNGFAGNVVFGVSHGGPGPVVTPISIGYIAPSPGIRLGMGYSLNFPAIPPILMAPRFWFMEDPTGDFSWRVY